MVPITITSATERRTPKKVLYSPETVTAKKIDTFLYNNLTKYQLK